ncbi:MAG: translocation/assembly module TamB, partial [Novosphingobium sp.]
MAQAVASRSFLWRFAMAMLRLLALIGLTAVVAFVVLDSPIGHRFVADRIASYAPYSGLRITVGRINGSLFGKAALRDVTFADSKGVFARVPEADIDWRPMSWFTSGLDVRRLSLRRGTLTRLPKLRPGDPEAPILPGFDIRVDQLEIVDLKLAEGVLGQPRRLDLKARVDIRSGRALVRLDSRLSGKDRLFALLDAEPDRDRFDLQVNLSAPQGGLLAELVDGEGGLDAVVTGKGGWRKWDGLLFARQDGRKFIALKLANRAGRYSVLGQAWPGDVLSGVAARAAGGTLSVRAGATLDDGVVDGDAALLGDGLRLDAKGAVDLTDNRFDDLRLTAVVRDPALAGGDLRLEGARATALLDGPFRDLEVDHRVVVGRLGIGTTRLENLSTQGVARYDGASWHVPLNLAADRIVTGEAAFDPRLVRATGRGTLLVTGTRITSDDLALDMPGLAARLHLDGDLAKGGYGLAGTAAVRGWPLRDIGVADAEGRLVLALGENVPWRLDVDLNGRLSRVDNATLSSLAGNAIRFAGRIGLGAGLPLTVEQARLDASKLSMTLAGRRLANGETTLAGSGRHATYGPFKVDASIAADGPRAVLVLADPWPPGELKDVRLALAPITGGFRIETEGGSALGPFKGTLGLFARAGEATRIEVERLAVWKTSVTGTVRLGQDAAEGALRLAGGGIDGTIALAPRDGGQGIDVALTADDASFEGGRLITIGSARLEASGVVAHDRSTLTGHVTGQGISIGQMFIGRMAANMRMENGNGQVTA